MNRIAIFVDGANVYYSQRDKLRWSIDWKRLVTLYERDFEIIEAFFYRADDGGIGTDNFGRMLVSSGYTLRTKTLKQVTNESSGITICKGNMDVELVIDALNTSPRYDTCLLISGDGDFVPLIEELRSRGKTVSVLSTFGSVAFELRSAVGKNYRDLQTLRSDIEYLPLPATTWSVPGIDDAEQHQDVVADSRKGVSTENFGGPTVLGSTALEDVSTAEVPVEAVVARIFVGGAMLTTSGGIEVFLPVTNMGLSGFVSYLPAIIHVGERFSVEVVALDESRSPPTKIVKLANDAERDHLQQRLDDLVPSLEDLPSDGEFDMDVQSVRPFGAFLRNQWNVPVLLHVSALNVGYVNDCTKLIRPGEKIRVRVTGREQNADGPRVNTALADEPYRKVLLERLAVASISLP